MSYHQRGAERPQETVCRYGASKLWFRGPERALDAPYVACVGAQETFGRFVEHPFPAVLERRTRNTCLNLGSLHCGVDALSHDRGLHALIDNAQLCVLQLPDLLGQTNHFFRVHPRRNDRFVAPTRALQMLYPEEDFTDVHFVQHLLKRLRLRGDDRFEQVLHVLRREWVGTLIRLLKRVRPDVLLLWLVVKRHEDTADGPEPITSDMVEQLRPYCRGIVRHDAQPAGESDELEDALFGTLQQPMAEHMLGPSEHRKIAASLQPRVLDLI